jgi:hypothetical protein
MNEIQDMLVTVSFRILYLHGNLYIMLRKISGPQNMKKEKNKGNNVTFWAENLKRKRPEGTKHTQDDTIKRITENQLMFKIRTEFN